MGGDGGHAWRPARVLLWKRWNNGNLGFRWRLRGKGVRGLGGKAENKRRRLVAEKGGAWRLAGRRKFAVYLTWGGLCGG